MGLFKNTFLNLIRIIYMNKIIDYNFCPVYFGSIKESGLTKLISSKYSNSRIIILVDQNTHDNCLDYLLDSCSLLQTADVVLMPVGEENKVIEVFYQVQQVLSDFHINRKGLIINLGGGVVTDMGGFISSVYKRGIDFIHIPTTLLGIVDASIGGKTGINIGPYKNQIGTFNHPVSIFMDSSFVKSLPKNEIMNGYAEMLKHALVMDRDYWNRIKNISSDEELIKSDTLIKSINIKTNVIDKDPKEGGLRKILNFGHTFGHAIEGFFIDKKKLSHGHCVALGICAESYLSMRRNYLSKKEYLEIENVIKRAFAFLSFDENAIKNIFELMKQDKKNNTEEVSCCLLEKIGVCIYDQKISQGEIMDALYHINLLAGTN